MAKVTPTCQPRCHVSRLLRRGYLCQAEVISEDIGIRDNWIRHKSRRIRKNFSADKDNTLREFIFISGESRISTEQESIEARLLLRQGLS